MTGGTRPVTAKTDGTFTLPPRFYRDHVSRDLPGGVVIKATRSAVTVALTGDEYDDLLSDAEHYAGGADNGFDPAEFGGLIASAKATVKRLRSRGTETGRQ